MEERVGDRCFVAADEGLKSIVHGAQESLGITLLTRSSGADLARVQF